MEILKKKNISQNNSVFVLQYNSDTDGNDVFCIIISSQHVQDVVQNMLFYSQQSLKNLRKMYSTAYLSVSC